jgi:hypothetical protein
MNETARLFLFRVSLIFGTFLILLSGAVGLTRAQGAIPAATSVVHMYRLSEIGKPGVPTILPEERSKLDRIVKSIKPAYRTNIWWAYSSIKKTSSSFVVIYVHNGVDPNTADPPHSGEHAYWRVLGAPNCNSVYSPITNMGFATPECAPIP